VVAGGRQPARCGARLDEVGDDAGERAHVGAHVQRVDDERAQVARAQVRVHHLRARFAHASRARPGERLLFWEQGQGTRAQVARAQVRVHHLHARAPRIRCSPAERWSCWGARGLGYATAAHRSANRTFYLTRVFSFGTRLCREEVRRHSLLHWAASPGLPMHAVRGGGGAKKKA